MDENKLFFSQSETITVSDMRKLMEITKSFVEVLTPMEFARIIRVYHDVVERLTIEGDDTDDYI